MPSGYKFKYNPYTKEYAIVYKDEFDTEEYMGVNQLSFLFKDVRFFISDDKISSFKDTATAKYYLNLYLQKEDRDKKEKALNAFHDIK